MVQVLEVMNGEVIWTSGKRIAAVFLKPAKQYQERSGIPNYQVDAPNGAST